MFYGLNKLIKKILPKQLFYRGLLIVATPVIILQIIIVIRRSRVIKKILFSNTKEIRDRANSYKRDMWNS